MSELRIRRENDSEIVLGHPHLGGWIFAAVGVAIAWAGQRYAEGFGSWLAIGMGVVFTLIGVGGGLWRYDLRLDLLARAYRGRRGFWPSPRGLSGSLEELKGLALSLSWRRSSSSNGDSLEHAVWNISLDFAGWDKPVSIADTTKEEKAYRIIERLARRLRVPVLDRTGPGEKRREWHELDRGLAQQGGARSDAPGAPPADSGIDWEPVGPPRRVVLPALGFNLGAVLLSLFGLLFAVVGGGVLLALGGVIDVPVKGSRAVGWILGSAFFAFGSFLTMGAWIGAYARQVVLDGGSELRFYLEWLGRRYRRSTVDKARIEEIELRESTLAASHRRRNGDAPPARQLVVRSDGRIVRLGDNLGPSSQEWLRAALRHLATG